MRGRRKVEASGTVLLEEDVVDVVDDADIAVKTGLEDDVNLVELVEVNEEFEGRRSRRRKRIQMAAETPELPATPPLSPEPDAEVPEVPFSSPELQLNRPVICSECDSKFEAPLDIRAARCPVCGENIAL
jgi:hypothetical protein